MSTFRLLLKTGAVSSATVSYDFYRSAGDVLFFLVRDLLFLFDAIKIGKTILTVLFVSSSGIVFSVNIRWSTHTNIFNMPLPIPFARLAI